MMIDAALQTLLDYDLYKLRQSIGLLEDIPPDVLVTRKTELEQYIIRLHHLLRRQEDADQ